MHDRHQVLRHFPLRRKALLVDHGDLAVSLGRQMFEQIEAEPHQAVLVRNNNMFYFPLQDSIKQFKKFLSPEIHAAADLLDPVVNGNPGTQTKSFHGPNLRGQVLLLGSTADSTINDGSPVDRFRRKGNVPDNLNVRLKEVAVPRRESFGHQLSLYLLSSDGLGSASN